LVFGRVFALIHPPGRAQVPALRREGRDALHYDRRWEGRYALDYDWKREGTEALLYG
jgi:hypothetical protein